MKKKLKAVVSVIMVLMLLLGVSYSNYSDTRAETKHYVTHQEYITYNGTYSHTCSLFTVDNAYTGYCIQHGLNPPLTNQEITTGVLTHASYDDMYKVLYYGFEGPEQWAGFTSANHAAAATQKMLSYYYYDNSVIGDDYMSFYEYLQTAPKPPKATISFSPATVTAYREGDVQRTDWITLTGDSRLTVTINLDSDMSLVKQSDGKSYTGAVTLKGGDKFYLTSTKAKNGTWTCNTKINQTHLFKIYIAYPTDSSLQHLVYKIPDSGAASLSVTYSGVGGLEIYKKSANPNITNGNSCYSLNGAVYNVYKSASDALAGTNVYKSITLNASGYGKLDDVPVGTYYIKEAKAPSGYALNNQVYPVTVNGGATAVCNTIDVPQMDPVAIMLRKENNSGVPLENAEFTFKFYEGIQSSTDPALSNIGPDKIWVMKTDVDGYIGLDDKFKVAGDDFYFSLSGNASLPLGTLTIQETKAPEGYVLDDTVIVRNITTSGAGEDVYTYNAPTVSNEIIKRPFALRKYGSMPDGTKMELSGAGFMACNVNDLTTDEDGNYIFDETKAVVLTASGDKELFTDATGYAESIPLDYGTYLVKETTVPDYHVACDDFIVTIETNGSTPDKVIDVIDEPKYPAIDTVARDMVSGNNFGIPNNDVNVSITDKVTLSNLENGHEYELIEVVIDKSTGDTVLIDETELKKTYSFKATDADMTFDANTFVFPREIAISRQFVIYAYLYDKAYPDVLLASHEDINDLDQTVSYPSTYANIEIVKTAETEDGSFKPLKGIEFGIYDKEESLVATIVTDEYGKASTGKLLLGTYTIKELNTPDIYIAAKPITVTLLEDGEYITEGEGEAACKIVCHKENIVNMLKPPTPKTGDTFTYLPVVTLVLSLACVVGLCFYMRRRKADNK